MFGMKKAFKYILIFVIVVSFLLSFNISSLNADSKSSVTEFVTRFYNLCLDRQPDADGLNTWVNNLLARKITGAQVAEGFIFSAEFTAKNTDNGEFLTILYRAFFNREPDGGGFDKWLSLLNAGNSRQFVLAGFVNSDEFKTLCKNYGITAGKLDPGKVLPTVVVANVELPVVALHGIEPDPQGRYETSTGAFEFMLSTLKSYGYQTITFADLLNHLDKGKPLPAKPIIITSDDGYQNTYAYAFPILKKYGYKMTIFLITSYIGNDEGSRRQNEFDFDAEGVPHRPMLTWPEVRAMSKYGIEFQSHTWSHGIITNMPIEQSEKELSQSKHDIEVNVGKPCFTVAWSHGIFNGEILSLLPKTGYRVAVTYDSGMNYLSGINLYDIKRLKIFAEISPLAYAQVLELK
jgi:peptidoglycan/xylan/chitin deacetylase (PgdA/CDA1 family)